MKITTKDIIKYLPLDLKVKNDLLESFDTLDADAKYNIESLLWDAYDALYQLRLQDNIRIAMEKAKKNEEPLDNGFYKRVREQTEKEMMAGYTESTTQVDLTSVRDKLQSLLNPPKPNQ